ncbi:hypothetical protein [Leptolyngbya ohadii]|uniref:hypothetical protein n=1 Tax=Leptolyngbya ohadii TaxID=1962290 RepID=UPI000B5998E1|nr:hypothetical protein [Leptolyngbya ohadii]
MFLRHQPENPLWSASSIRALSDKNDNSFRTATNLGTIKPGRSFSFRTRGFVGAGDRADYFQFKVLPGVELRDSLRITADGNGANLSVFIKVGNGRIQKDGDTLTINPVFPLSGQGTLFNSTGVRATYYLRLTPFDGDSTYRIAYSGTL